MTAMRAAAVLWALVAQVTAPEALRPLLDFAGPDVARKWQAVNDGVMGGVSDGRFTIAPEGTMVFFGTLSLENNGGFASVRTKPAEFAINPGSTLVVRVKGDGREYVLNVYTKSRKPCPQRPPTAVLERLEPGSDQPGTNHACALSCSKVWIASRVRPVPPSAATAFFPAGRRLA